MVVNLQVGAGNQILVLCMNSQCAELLSHLSSHRLISYKDIWGGIQAPTG